MDVEVGTVWRATAITAVGGTVAAVSGALIASGAGNDISRGYAMRVVVLTIVVLAAVVVCAGRCIRLGRRGAFVPSLMLGSAIGFVLNPVGWGGHAYVAQLALGAGALTGVVDVLLLIALTGAIAVTLGTRLVHSDDRPSVRRNSYLSEGWRS